MGTDSTAFVCPNCNEVTYISETNILMNEGKPKCSNCGHEIRTGAEGIEEQVLLHIKKMGYLHGVMFYNKATGSGLDKAKIEVDRMAKSRGIPIPKSKCFIAAAAYGSETQEEVFILRIFRDEKLLKTRVGRKLVKVYNILSPSAAKFISERERVRVFVQKLLKPIIIFARKRIS